MSQRMKFNFNKLLFNRWFLFHLAFLLLFYPKANYGMSDYSVLETYQDSLVIEVKFPQPASFQSGLEQETVLQNFKQIYITTQGKLARIAPIKEEWIQLSSGLMQAVIKDMSIGMENTPDRYRPDDALSTNWYTIDQISSEGNHTLWRIRINQYEIDQNKHATRYLKKAIFHLSGNEINTTKGLNPNIDKSENAIRSQIRNSDVTLQNVTSNPNESHVSRLHIPISQEGLYVITRNQMLEGGWKDFNTDPRYLRVTSKDGEIPIRIAGESDGRFDAGDYIEFWGEPNWEFNNANDYHKNPYDTLNVYWLEVADHPGLRMGSESGVPAEPSSSIINGPRSFLYTEHFEKDGHFDRLPYELDLEEGDRWFYNSPIIGGAKREYVLKTPSQDEYAINLATFRIKVRGLSSNLLPQPVEIFINDRLVIPETQVHNQTMILESSGFSPTYLADENTITVSNRSSENELAKLYVDWYEITYPCLYETETDFLKFAAPKNSLNRQVRFEISGFSNSNIEIYKLNSGRFHGFEVESITDTLDNTTFTAILMDQVFSESDQYVALTPRSKSLPDTVYQVMTPDLRISGLGADYIFITPDDSLGQDILQPLIDVRESQGLTCKVVCLDTIFDNFSHGIRGPEAIHMFLQYAYTHWTPRPRFCLLIGDGYYRHLQNIGVENLTPVYHFQTWKYGAAASDYRYSLLVGDDDFAEIAIGRLPVQDQEELSVIVDKIVSYETSPPEPWKNRYLLIGSGGTDDVFRVQSEHIINEIVPDAIRPERLYLSGSLLDPYVGGTEDLLRHMRDGVALVNFRGHGGGAIWADAGLLDLDDIELIDNSGRLPIMTSMTCFTADFASQRISLGEALICEPENGAIAFWGASGVGWVNADYYMVQELFKIFETQPELTLGEMIQLAKRNFLIAYPGTISRSDAYQYNLLGDPAMTMPFPKNELESEIAERSIAFDTPIQISGISESAPFNISIEITGENGDPQFIQELSFNNTTFNAEILPPSTLRTGGVRLYAWNEEDGYQANAYLPFEIGNAFFDSLQTEPAEPAFGDTLFFSVRVADYQGIESIWCQLNILSKDTTLSFPDSLMMEPTSNPEIYQTAEGLTGFQPGDFIQYEIGIRNNASEKHFSGTQFLNIQTLPDLIPQNVRLGGVDQVLLQVDIRNIGRQSVQNVPIRFLNQNTGWTTSIVTDIPSSQTITAEIPWNENVSKMDIQVTVNSDSTLLESRYENNIIQSSIEVNHYLITASHGSGGWIGFTGEFQVSVPEKSISQNNVLSIDRISQNQLPGTNQSMHGSATAYDLNLPDSSSISSVQPPFSMRWTNSSNDSAESLYPYYWSIKQNQWVFLQYDQSDSIYTFQNDQLGYVWFMEKSDDQAPNIEIHVDNQLIVSMAYVPKNPKISELIYDETGVDKRLENLQILLDHQVVDPNQLMLSDSTVGDSKRMHVQFQPQLTPGNHRLEIQASDINGNAGFSDPVDFQVSSRFQAIFLGNYPNPFSYETVFVYSLTDMAERVTLKIYTVSGRLIRKFDNPAMTAPDYHELVWDGNDEWGEEVANGVYFFRLKADGFSRNDEVTGKIAKIR